MLLRGSSSCSDRNMMPRAWLAISVLVCLQATLAFSLPACRNRTDPKKMVVVLASPPYYSWTQCELRLERRSLGLYCFAGVRVDRDFGDTQAWLFCWLCWCGDLGRSAPEHYSRNITLCPRLLGIVG